MRIGASQVSMDSTHSRNSYTKSVTHRIDSQVAYNNGFFSLKVDGETTGSGISTSERREWNRMAGSLGQMKSFEQTAQDIKAQCEEDIRALDIKSPQEMKIDLLMWLLDMLCGKKTQLHTTSTDPQKAVYDTSDLYSISAGTGTDTDNTTATFWQKLETTDTFTTEEEATTFGATGTVVTSDGRHIDFDMELSLSRSFTQETGMSWMESGGGFSTDPLVINYDTPATELSTQKFFFDLDSDGQEEMISRPGYGSGFLALDKNNDGKINDGSELFGTKSGDGFKDLSTYDSDGNGWIDENDEVFNKLRIWTQDEAGNDELIDLRSADIGAIFLGNASTDYSLNDSLNRTHGQIRKTGIFLHESSGLAGTLNHVDLAAHRV